MIFITRLTSGDLSKLGQSLDLYDEKLEQLTGCRLRQLACTSIGTKEPDFLNVIQQVPLAVIPITAGKGVITGFGDSVRAIANHLGFQAQTTKATDVDGLREAIKEQNTLVTMADDNRFIALNLNKFFMAENSFCTAKGFVTALDLMCGGVSEKEVLVIGCGEVGYYACSFLAAAGADIAVYDPAQRRVNYVTENINNIYNVPVRCEKSLPEALPRYELMFDASPASNIIPKTHISKKTLLAAPGVPPGPTRAAIDFMGNRYLHDPLQIGTAVMLVSAALATEDRF